MSRAIRTPAASCTKKAAPISRICPPSLDLAREHAAPVQHATRLLQASLASCAAVVLMISGPAEAISGGKQSVGIFKPLDDADLSGESRQTCSARLVAVNIANQQPSSASSQSR